MTYSREIPQTSCTIFDLPTELLIHILSQLSTKTLLFLTTTSCKFYNVIIRILYQRLRTATVLAEHRIQLESYHPSAKYTTPWWFCDYLGTDGLDTREIEKNLYSDVSAAGKLGKLSSLYSHFRPTEAKDRRFPIRHPAGEVPGHPDTSIMYPTSIPEYLPEDVVSQIVSLDINERFSQLCVVANLVRLGSSINWLINSVTMGEGVVRVFRIPKASGQADPASPINQEPMSRNSISQESNLTQRDFGDERILWVDESETVGLKVRVTEQKSNRVQPLLLKDDDEVAVSYKVEYEGSPYIG